jgi:hypothetical protein
MKSQVMSGSTTGTGAVINIELGWIPDHVRVANITDTDTIDDWWSSMADGTSLTTTTAVATRATNGISPYAGDTTHKKGFTIGSGISESGKTLAWVAMRNGQ